VAISSQGITFSFSGAAFSISGGVTSISIEEAQPEIVDMTGATDSVGARKMMSTGDVLTPPKVTIDYFRTGNDLAGFAPADSAGDYGAIVLQHAAFTVAKNAIIESASTELAVGDAIRGKITFIINPLE
jgi:hypothetical protein